MQFLIFGNIPLSILPFLIICFASSVYISAIKLSVSSTSFSKPGISDRKASFSAFRALAISEAASSAFMKIPYKFQYDAWSDFIYGSKMKVNTYQDLYSNVKPIQY